MAKQQHAAPKRPDDTALKARIDALFAAWLPRAGLGCWLVESTFIDDAAAKAWASTNAVWNCRMATITFNLHHLRQATERQVEMIVVHELVHVIESPTKFTEPEAQKQAKEHVVTHIAQILIALANDGR